MVQLQLQYRSYDSREVMKLHVKVTMDMSRGNDSIRAWFEYRK